MKIIVEIVDGKKGKHRVKLGKKKRRKIEDDTPLMKQLRTLSDVLSSNEQPDKNTIIGAAAPVMEFLEKGGIVANGDLDVLPYEVRKSVLMLFLVHMLRDAEPVAQQKQDFPDKVPLDISEGDNIPTQVVDGQVAYKRKPQQKLDKGF